MKVLYNPPPPHKCRLPFGENLNEGAIAQCPECHKYSRYEANSYYPNMYSWRVMGFFETMARAMFGQIPDTE